MLKLAAIALAAASVSTPPAPTSTAPWWEKVTITFNGDGMQQSCRFETSFPGAAPESCEAEELPASVRHVAAGGTGVNTTITFERRFTPSKVDDVASLDPGDTLLGGHVLMLAIGGDGAVDGCEVVAKSEDGSPNYGCDEVRAERFEASAGPRSKAAQVGFLTVLVYGHQEQVV